MSPISHSYKLDQSISAPRIVWLYLYSYSDFNRTFYKKPWRPWSDAEEQSLNELMSSRYWQVSSSLDNLSQFLHQASPILTLYN